MDPDVILVRAIVAGTVIAVTVAAFRVVVVALCSQMDDD
jgi:hypothetical protein